MTDNEIVDAIKDKYEIPLATGVFRKAHLDLVRMGREAERSEIMAWLRKNGKPQIADAIEAKEHLE